MRVRDAAGASSIAIAVGLAVGCSVVNAVDEPVPVSPATGGQGTGAQAGSGGDGAAPTGGQGGTGGHECIPPYTTLTDCGECGRPCAPANVVGASCATGDCTYESCTGAFQDCDGDAWNGCESNSFIDPEHCGSCETDCAEGGLENVVELRCSQAVCDYTVCVTGYDDCDGSRSNGCETEVMSLDECGQCDTPCVPDHVVDPTCATGECDYGQCETDYQDCDGNRANGCESDSQTDHEHCGSCTNPCEATQSCVDGECRDPIYEDCQQTMTEGGQTSDGVYWIDPSGGDPADAIQVFCNMQSAGGGWTTCFELENTAAEDFNNNYWLDRCVDWSMAAWSGTAIMLEIRDASDVIVYQTTGTRALSWTYANVTSTVDAGSQYDFHNHTLQALSNGDQLMIPGNTSSNSGCVGSMGNGYGIVVYPPGTPTDMAPKIMVMPYRHQVGSNNKRDFGAGNQQWFENNEITYDGTTTWSSCGYPPSYLGTFRFYVR